MNQKFQQKIYNVNINVDLMRKKLIQINSGITVNVDVSVKNVIYVKKITSGMLPYEVMKMKNIQQVLWMIQGLRVMKLFRRQLGN